MQNILKLYAALIRVLRFKTKVGVWEGGGTHVNALTQLLPRLTEENHHLFSHPHHHQASPGQFSMKRCDCLQGYQIYHGMQGKGTWVLHKSCYVAFRAEGRVGRGRNQSGLGKNKCRKTEGCGDKWDRSPMSRSVCMSSCALPQITTVCPVYPLISICNFP